MAHLTHPNQSTEVAAEKSRRKEKGVFTFTS